MNMHERVKDRLFDLEGAEPQKDNTTSPGSVAATLRPKHCEVFLHPGPKLVETAYAENGRSENQDPRDESRHF